MNKNTFVVATVMSLAAAGFLMSGCTQKTSSPNQAQHPPTPQTQTQPTTSDLISIAGFQFSPSTLTVKVGAPVKVINNDSVGHSVTSDDGTSFDTRILPQGQSAEFRAPTKPGSYPFHCTAHPMMTGTLIVE
jgi:plastocyanin